MTKSYVRWYEKDEHLRAFMSLMQDLSIEIQCEIAIDIILKASSMIDRDYSKIISEVADYNPRNWKRWYDKNPNVHLAIEALRDLTESQRDEIIKDFGYFITFRGKSQIFRRWQELAGGFLPSFAAGILRRTAHNVTRMRGGNGDGTVD